MNVELLELFLMLIPLLLVQLTLQVIALISLKRRKTVRFKNKWIWVIIIVLGTLVGSITYFIFGGKGYEDGSND